MERPRINPQLVGLLVVIGGLSGLSPKPWAETVEVKTSLPSSTCPLWKILLIASTASYAVA